MKRLTVYIPDIMHRIVKILCAKTDMAVTNYIVALIEADLKKRGEV